MSWDHVFAGRFNGGEPVCIGGIHRDSLSVLAEREVLRITQWHEPLALTVEPDGAVYVEPVISADLDDLVAVYALDECEFRLKSRIRADLRDVRMARRAMAKPAKPIRREGFRKQGRIIVAELRAGKCPLSSSVIRQRYGVSKATAVRALVAVRGRVA